MPTTHNGQDFQAELRRLDALLQESGRITDPAAQAHIQALVQAVLGLHGAGLARVLTHLEEAGESARSALDACVKDEVVAGLLLLHGLHPMDTEERVREAMEQIGPALQSHGVTAELAAVDDGAVRLRLEGGCDCPSSSAAIRQTIEEAIFAKAPDATAVEIEGLAEIAAAENGRVPLPLL